VIGAARIATAFHEGLLSTHGGHRPTAL